MTKSATKQATVNIGLIGHVDAGKTSLVESLAGKWTDTHSEELKRGISIRTGYADAEFYYCKKCGGYFSKNEKCGNCKAEGNFIRKVSFVDAPGHETLMTTMLSGAALMHGAILVIAANEECPQPQTIEHLNAVIAGGIKNIVVAQNKIDLVSKEEALKNYQQITKLLKEYKLDAQIIPTAAHLNINTDLLIEAIEKNIKTPKLEEKKPLLMFCGRSFDVNQPGAKISELKGGVLGGTISRGIAKKGDKIEISPGYNSKKIETEIRNVSCATGKLEKGKPGGLIAIETALDPATTQNDKMRGQVIGKAGSLPEPSTEIIFEINYLERVVSKVPREFKPEEPVVITIGTMNAVGAINENKGKKLKVKLKKPAAFQKNQKIAVSKMHESRWRLVGYGIVQ